MVEVVVEGFIRGVRMLVDAEIYFLGSMSGEGARLEEGQSRV